MAQFALSWDAHQKNICNGLSSLQQNGEFVDMTLAADGHFVKVHQMIMALASPYLKELISSAPCQHPVIFLNNVSHSTLCSILEYIYTGEVLISAENFNSVIEAGKNLHVRGLCEMEFQGNRAEKQLKIASDPQVLNEAQIPSADNMWLPTDNIEEAKVHFDSRGPKESKEWRLTSTSYPESAKRHRQTRGTTPQMTEESILEDSFMDISDDPMDKMQSTITVTDGDDHTVTQVEEMLHNKTGAMLYTLSTQGSLQLILNRFLYYLKHSNKNRLRQWRCVDYVTSVHCPAHVVTNGDVVVRRKGVHTHPYHDDKIMKKYKLGSIFSASHDAEQEGIIKKTQNKGKTDGDASANVE